MRILFCNAERSSSPRDFMNSAVLLHLGFVMWHPLNRAAENCTLALLSHPRRTF